MDLIVKTARGTEVRVTRVPPGMEDRVKNELRLLLGEEVTVRRPTVDEDGK